jgi:hypothetical protein
MLCADQHAFWQEHRAAVKTMLRPFMPWSRLLTILHRIDTFDTLEWAKRWADPWDERIWEGPSDADETAVLISTRKKPGAL